MMKPFSVGHGKERYTVYFPFYIPNEEKRWIAGKIFSALSKKLENTHICKHEKFSDLDIIRVIGFDTENAAEDFFHGFKAGLVLISMENRTAINFSRDYSKPDNSYWADLRFPSGWQPGVDHGWKSNNGFFVIDGVVTVGQSLIYPEHKLIVEDGAVFAKLVTKPNYESITQAVDYIVDNKKSKFAVCEEKEKAGHIYASSLSLNDSSLKYLQMCNCLELIAGSEGFSSPTKANKKKHLASLVSKYSVEIGAQLPIDHPHKNNPAAAIDGLWETRNKVAHEGTYGEFITDEIDRSEQFVRIACSAVIKKIYGFELSS